MSTRTRRSAATMPCPAASSAPRRASPDSRTRAGCATRSCARRGRLTMLKHLFDAELVYRSEMEPLTEDGEGELIGSGDGTVAGPAIAGQLAWTLFERPGRLVCAMNPVAVIETDEGERVRIEARGFARRENEASRRWAVAATLRFESEHERYRRLENALGVWEGEFDAEAHRARYRAYLVRNGLNGDQR